MAPKFEDNIILTKTERLMMSNRPTDPKNARNKNVLIVGGSGSGKTRFWLKPNLLQCHSSYVVTDPKGDFTMEFFNAAVDVMKTVVVALGGGLGVWGAVNLLEGYGGDNPSAKSQGMKQLVAGGGVALIGITLVPQLANLFG